MPKLSLERVAIAGLAAIVMVAAYQNCAKPLNIVAASSTLAGSGGDGQQGAGTGADTPNEPVVAGGGEKLSGNGTLSVPTAYGIVAKIENGLKGNALSTAGNFASALAQVKNNLPQVSDPTQATGYDQVQLLVYAACSDLTTGATPKMKSVYQVDPAKTIAANRGALVSAGVAMLDQYVAGLASQGPTSAQVADALGKVVDQVAGVATNTSKIAFVSVCIAANTAGATMLGF